MTLTIVTVEQAEYRHVLKTPALPVYFPLNQEDKTLIAAMKTKLHSLGGVGLAAPQVDAPRRIMAIYIPEEARLLREDIERVYPMHVMINPAYEPMAGSALVSDFEGCYSVSSRAGKVPRYEQIKVNYADEEGNLHEQIVHGFYARVVQHEVDHLNGFLITDRLTPDCIQGTVAEMSALRRAALPEEKRALFDAAMSRKEKNNK